MLTPITQRWQSSRASYRPAGELISTSAYTIAPILTDTPARTFVQTHHYSRSYPAARRRFGLYRHDTLVGVAVYSQPYAHTTRTLFPQLADPQTVLELGRLVLLDDVPANGESWFVAETFRQLRTEGFAGVFSLSDPVARPDASGTLTFPGHIGTIYQALNAAYRHFSRARILRLLPDGTIFNERAMTKIRARARGWQYASAILVAHGASPLQPSDNAAAWLSHWLPQLTAPLRHTGNHRYIWLLDRKHHARLDRPAYPKLNPAFWQALRTGSIPHAA